LLSFVGGCRIGLGEVDVDTRGSARSLRLVYGRMGKGWLLLIYWCGVCHLVVTSHEEIFVVAGGRWLGIGSWLRVAHSN